MIIKNAIKDLETAENPVTKILHRGANSMVIVLAFKAGMILKKHKSDVDATLIVVSGKVNYTNSEKTVTLDKYDNFSILAHEFHEVEALEDAICFLIKA